jgi:hypothetical protein
VSHRAALGVSLRLPGSQAFRGHGARVWLAARHQGTEVAPLDGFLIMLRSTSNERAAAIWREQIEQHYQKALVALAPGALAAERSALLLALIVGFQVMRQVVGVSALVEADPAALSGLLACIFQSLVHSDHR